MNAIRLEPMLPWPLLLGLAAVCVLALLPAAWRRARGVWLRALAFAVILATLAGPVLLHEDQRYLPDIALLVTDHTGSMGIRGRAAVAEAARARIEAEARRIPGLVLREAVVPPGGNGTRLFESVGQALADIPPGRLAGVVAITDGQVHDRPARALGAPLQVLIPARGEEVDRRLRVVEAPPYGIVGQTATIRVVVEDLGAHDDGTPVTVTLRRDGEAPGTVDALVGRKLDIDVPIRAVGPSLLELSAAALPGEVSAVNNRAVVQINGVRDRLHVLLVSGQPNQGERAWRRLLKADPSVDLVHFTILRLPDRDDMTPLNELALIAFPTRELFQEKINDFDLIILDRFEDRGILPVQYLENIADFVRRGGGLLLTAGPEFAGTGSLQNTPLGDVLPVHVPGDGGVTETPFRPALTAAGRAHPVTAGLVGASGPNWGPWYRALASDQTEGEVLMSGPDGHPLLVLDHREQGRVAVLLSDQIWLWARGEDGGGPQAELLRRVSHWLMKEPDLEEERLTASIEGGTLHVDRRTLAAATSVEATVTAPDGTVRSLRLAPAGDGHEAGSMPAAGEGIWRVRAAGAQAFAAAAAADPLEEADLRATASVLAAGHRGVERQRHVCRAGRRAVAADGVGGCGDARGRMDRVAGQPGARDDRGDGNGTGAAARVAAAAARDGGAGVVARRPGVTSKMVAPVATVGYCSGQPGIMT